jgi:hypothetical protein
MERTPSMSELNEIMYGQVKNSYYIIHFVVCTHLSLCFFSLPTNFVALLRFILAAIMLTAISLTHLDSKWLYISNLMFVQFLCDIDVDNYIWPFKVVLVSRQRDSLYCSSPLAVL